MAADSERERGRDTAFMLCVVHGTERQVERNVRSNNVTGQSGMGWQWNRVSMRRKDKRNKSVCLTLQAVFVKRIKS